MMSKPALMPKSVIRTILPGGALAALLLLPSGAFAADLEGRVELLRRGGKKPCKGCDATQAVVYYEPENGVAPAEPGTFEIVTEGKSFMPRVLTVPLGSTVRFPNRDPILHNVFSVSKGNSFDLGLYRGETVGEMVFERPGVVRVFCNVHSSMVAYVLVLDTPHVTSPNADGSFEFSDLPPGDGRLTVWHERGEPQSLELRLPSEASFVVEIEALRPQVPDHLNKLGNPYSRSRRDDY